MKISYLAGVKYLEHKCLHVDLVLRASALIYQQQFSPSPHFSALPRYQEAAITGSRHIHHLIIVHKCVKLHYTALHNIHKRKPWYFSRSSRISSGARIFPCFKLSQKIGGTHVKRKFSAKPVESLCNRQPNSSSGRCSLEVRAIAGNFSFPSTAYVFSVVCTWAI